MNTENHNRVGYSANLRGELRVNGQIFAIAQLGPNFLVLEHCVDHLPGDAEIVMWIDGVEKRWRVHLVDGIKTGQRKTSICRCPDKNGAALE